jgi:hypothetical protein
MQRNNNIITIVAHPTQEELNSATQEEYLLHLTFNTQLTTPYECSQRRNVKTTGRWHKVDAEQSGCKFKKYSSLWPAQ